MYVRYFNLTPIPRQIKGVDCTVNKQVVSLSDHCMVIVFYFFNSLISSKILIVQNQDITILLDCSIPLTCWTVWVISLMKCMPYEINSRWRKEHFPSCRKQKNLLLQGLWTASSCHNHLVRTQEHWCQNSPWVGKKIKSFLLLYSTLFSHF